MHTLNQWFAFDWPWIFPAILLLLILLYRFAPSQIVGSAHACGFVITFFLPIVLPLTAAFGIDFWWPLLAFWVLFFVALDISANRAGEAGIIFMWHPFVLAGMTLLAMIIRLIRYLS